MIIDSKSGLRGVLIDAETGERLAFARWANLATGEYEAFAATPDGRQILQPPRLVRGRRNRLKFVEAAPRYPSGPGKLVIPEDEPPRRDVQRVPMVPGRPCEVRGCGKLAEWQVADAEELAPATLPDGTKAERSRVAAVHLYCSWHYRFPTWKSLRGVESEMTQVTARPE